MISVKFKDVNKTYSDGTRAVINANFEINKGEFLVLVGPSGCGKSTILKMIAGLEDVTDGKILFDEKVVNDLPPKKRNIGMVFQNYALYPHLNVFDNIAFPLKIKGFNKNIIKKEVDEIAQKIGLKEYLRKKPKHLSGGQRQRVALARAISRKPDLFLFDEPLSNLDAKLRVQMRTEIHNLHINFKTTSIYVTHDQFEAMTMGTKLVVMNAGIIQQIASPNEIYENPVNKFVAGFIGSPQMNFIEGKITLNKGLIFEDIHSNHIFSIKPGILKNPNISEEDIYSLGIRPENIDIMKSSGNNTDFIKTKIVNIEYLGNETFVYFYFDNKLNCLRTNKNITCDIGEEVYFIFDKNKYLFFNKNGERA